MKTVVSPVAGLAERCVPCAQQVFPHRPSLDRERGSPVPQAGEVVRTREIPPGLRGGFVCDVKEREFSVFLPARGGGTPVARQVLA
jgi:hypothetical protein